MNYNIFDNKTEQKNIVKSRILVVDDNLKNLQYATKVLIEAGYDISVAQSGLSALNYLQKTTLPDLILLDVMMPEMSGYEVCEKLKSSDHTKDIPVIFLTAKNETDDIVKGFELGGVDYISKPFQPKEILVRIKTHIDLIKAKRELVEKNKLLDTYNKSLIEQITDRTNALITAQNNIENYKEIKANFLAQISHEIRTPVNVIVNYLTLLKIDSEDLGVANPDNELFFAVNSASKRLIRTIDMIITMSELQKNIYHIQKSTVLLFSEILSPLIDNYTNQAIEKGLYLTVENNSSLKFVSVDKDAVYTIFDNILDNALKYTDKGKIIVSLNSEAEKSLTIKIKDTGIGISQSYLDSIYKPFSQEDEGYTRKFEGNGLGLPISKRLCELSDIDFFIESDKNVGTTVTLVFKTVE